MRNPDAHLPQDNAKRTTTAHQRQNVPQWFYHTFFVGSYFDVSMASAVITNSHPLLVIMRPEAASQDSQEGAGKADDLWQGAGAPRASHSNPVARIPVPGNYVI